MRVYETTGDQFKEPTAQEFLKTMKYPEDVTVVVLEDEGRVVGHCCVAPVTHFENIYLDPQYRGNPAAGKKLLEAAYSSARAQGDAWVMVFVGDAKIASMVQRLNGKHVSGDTYVLPVE